MQVTPPLWKKQRGTKEPLDESEKSGLKLNIQKTKFMSTGSITLQQIDGETMEKVTDFILFSWTPRSLQKVTTTIKLSYLLL